MNKFSMIFSRVLCALLLSLVLVFVGCTEEPAPIAVTSVTLDSSSMTLVEGDTQKLTATISPSNAENKAIIWTSSNSSVASVKEGTVTAFKEGEATITAKSDDGGKTATCKVTVTPKVIQVTKVSLDKTSCEMIEGDEFTLTATVKPDNATNKNVIWSSSNTSVATVDNGKIKALKAGTATITVKTEDGNRTATCETTVNAKVYPVTGVTLNKTSYEMTEGDEVTLAATVSPENATNKNVIWSSSNTSVATVNDGKVTALKVGTTTITVKTEDGAKTATCEILVLKGQINLSSKSSANCYIISEANEYKFAPTKGKSNIPIKEIASVEVLWESYLTDEIINAGDLINYVQYKNNFIIFGTPEKFKEGNAVIVAKNAQNIILWSWHIWLTDMPKEQIYNNHAGSMMDRNLGATSAIPGNHGTCGLLYQWGRKDPFLGTSSCTSFDMVQSTITWPTAVDSNSSNGTIEFATANPTTYIKENKGNYDWYYTGNGTSDHTRWTESEKEKSIYDPCPIGWRVPDGGKNGIWSIAAGHSSEFIDNPTPYDGVNFGMNFFGKFGRDSVIWYPALRTRNEEGDLVKGKVTSGSYWSASLFYSLAGSIGSYYFRFDENEVDPSAGNARCRAIGRAVRCVKE